MTADKILDEEYDDDELYDTDDAELPADAISESDDEYIIDLDGFAQWLKSTRTKRKDYRSDSTIKKHVEDMLLFIRLSDSNAFSPKTIGIAMEEAKERFAANTAKGLSATINLYCEYIGHKDWRTSQVKVQRKQFLDDVLSMADYEFALKKAKAMRRWRVYLYMRIAGTTGMRLCEMLQIKREHIEHGCVDLYGKGAKQRRIYFPTAMRDDALQICDMLGIKSGHIFSTNKTTIQHLLQRLNDECEFPKGLLHPHGFRHFFAKEFIRKYQNIALLADLLGHNNIETTRIYLKYTSREQADIVNEVVTW